MRDIDEITKEELDKVQRYSSRIIAENPFAFEQFLSATVYFQMTGQFNDGYKRTPTILEVSLETDKSGYPMFPEEIQELIDDLREQLEYPEDFFGLEYKGVPCNELLTHAELVALCIYMESRHAGSGLFVYGVRKQ